jgi:hypothetical protein
MKKFTVFYRHKDYGFSSWDLEDHADIAEALAYFIKHVNHEEVYGIMQLR